MLDWADAWKDANRRAGGGWRAALRGVLAECPTDMLRRLADDAENFEPESDDERRLLERIDSVIPDNPDPLDPTKVTP